MASSEDWEGESEEWYDHSIKILMIGDSGVGKTCLVLRYTSDQYSSTFITTIGIDYKKQTLTYKGQKIGMQIWGSGPRGPCLNYR